MKRRVFVRNTTLSAFSIAAFGDIRWNGRFFEGDNVTTTDILGPFYRPGSPMRSNLIPKGFKGEVMHLSGTIFRSDGKTPLSGVLVESWQCDEQEHYDNTSDDYVFRGAVKTGKDGRYAFKTMVPVPYKDGDSWRPAHIHLRISSKDHQDLITQIYFKGDPHIEGDGSAGSPQSVSRILEIRKQGSDESMVKFDVVMGKSFPLDDAGYKKITGIYQLKDGLAEFTRQDDLLMLKLNGQIMEGMVYKGNNSFEGGLGFNKAKFELMASGDVKVTLTMWENWIKDQPPVEAQEGIKVFNYGN